MPRSGDVGGSTFLLLTLLGRLFCFPSGQTACDAHQRRADYQKSRTNPVKAKPESKKLQRDHKGNVTNSQDDALRFAHSFCFHSLRNFVNSVNSV
jgi:hypothetical protein